MQQGALTFYTLKEYDKDSLIEIDYYVDGLRISVDGKEIDVKDDIIK